jgi:hypothetical protein
MHVNCMVVTIYIQAVRNIIVKGLDGFRWHFHTYIVYGLEFAIGDTLMSTKASFQINDFIQLFLFQDVINIV